eukprot:7391263-Prymnesium_polylepis.1
MRGTRPRGGGMSHLRLRRRLAVRRGRRRRIRLRDHHVVVTTVVFATVTVIVEYLAFAVAALKDGGLVLLELVDLVLELIDAVGRGVDRHVRQGRPLDSAELVEAERHASGSLDREGGHLRACLESFLGELESGDGIGVQLQAWELRRRLFVLGGPLLRLRPDQY